MTARTGMANPILKLRNLAQVGTADYQVGTVYYWTDNQLQDVLDDHAVDLWRYPLTSQYTNDGSGTAKYYDYYFPPSDYDEGTAAFIVANSLGSAVTPTTYEYMRGHLSFGTVNQLGTAYYLTARKFDINASAADVWKRKASQVASAYSFSADGQTMNRSDLQKQYLQMAREFEALSEPMTVSVTRGDEP